MTDFIGIKMTTKYKYNFTKNNNDRNYDIMTLMETLTVNRHDKASKKTLRI